MPPFWSRSEFIERSGKSVEQIDRDIKDNIISTDKYNRIYKSFANKEYIEGRRKNTPIKHKGRLRFRANNIFVYTNSDKSGCHWRFYDRHDNIIDVMKSSSFKDGEERARILVRYHAKFHKVSTIGRGTSVLLHLTIAEIEAIIFALPSSVVFDPIRSKIEKYKSKANNKLKKI